MTFLSILIPTRDRGIYLDAALKSALDQSSDDFEIVVQDNASEDHTEALCTAIADERVKYFKSTDRLSMSDNWEAGVQRCKGKYVVIVGDDDAVVVQSIHEFVNAAEAQNCPELIAWNLPYYRWPAEGGLDSVFSVPAAAAVGHASLVEKSNRAMWSGGLFYATLPRGYHTAVRRDIYDALKAQHGRVFFTTLPDVYLALTLSSILESAYFLDFPVTIIGNSPKSNGAAFYTRSNARANHQRFISEFKDYKLDERANVGLDTFPQWWIETAFVARDQHPQRWANVAISSSFFWAYWVVVADAVWKRGVSASTVLDQRTRLERQQAFSTTMFCIYFLLLQPWQAARRIRDTVRRMLAARSGTQRTFATIYEFSQSIRRPGT